MTDTPTYAVWCSMRRRCTIAEPRYGARGVRVCERWSVFENFLADMGPRPEGTSLDRIDVDGDYEPSNCRWATDFQQQRNRSNNRRIVVGAISHCLSEWAEITGIPSATIARRLDRGWSPERATSARAH
jgi:hypothetical protein